MLVLKIRVPSFPLVPLFAFLLYFSPAVLRGENLHFSFDQESRIPRIFSPNPAPNGSTTSISLVSGGPDAGLKISDSDAKAGVGLSALVKIEPAHLYRQMAVRKGGPLMFYFKWLDENKKFIPPEHAQTFKNETSFQSAEYSERSPENARYCQIWIYSASTMTTEVILKEWSFTDMGL
ncbi:MAG: hypothetical protein JNM63_13620, partial [Spirochaetia bacterium]|nr:hypothetical protein [Spirochaetia bacterium]